MTDSRAFLSHLVLLVFHPIAVVSILAAQGIHLMALMSLPVPVGSNLTAFLFDLGDLLSDPAVFVWRVRELVW